MPEEEGDSFIPVRNKHRRRHIPSNLPGRPTMAPGKGQNAKRRSQPAGVNRGPSAASRPVSSAIISRGGGSKERPDVCSRLLDESLKEGLLLEGLIIEYSLQVDRPALFQRDLEQAAAAAAPMGSMALVLKKLHFLHKFGDPFMVLSVAREWAAVLAGKGDVDGWCAERGVVAAALAHMESYVERRHSELLAAAAAAADGGAAQRLCFSSNAADADDKLVEILVDVYSGGLCVYRGHPELGFWAVSSFSSSLHLHPLSALGEIGIRSPFIIALTEPSDSGSIFSAIPLSETTGRALFDAKFPTCTAALDTVIVAPVTLPDVPDEVIDELRTTLDVGSRRQEILARCQGNTLLVSSGSEKNKLTVYVAKADADTVKSLLEEAVGELRREFSHQQVELPYPLPTSPLRALVQSGGVVPRLLFPHDFRSILVRPAGGDTGVLTKEAVQSALRPFGEIERIRYSDLEGVWGVVVFKEPESVQRALADYASLEDILVELTTSPSRSEHRKPFTIDLQVRRTVKLCRRPFDTGIAWVTFRGNRKYSRAIDAPAFQLSDGSVRKLKPAHGGRFLLEGLHPHTTERDIRQGLAIVDLDPEEVCLQRRPPFECSPREMEKFRSGLIRVLDKVTDVRKVNIQVRKVEAEDTHLSAIVTFADRRTAVSATEALAGKKIQQQKMEMADTQEDDDVDTKIHIQHELYKAVSADLDRLLKKCKHVSVNMKDTATGFVLEIPRRTSVREVNAFLAQIQELLEPLVICLSKARLQYLTRRIGQVLIQYIMIQSNTCIHREGKLLKIYGNGTVKRQVAAILSIFIRERADWFEVKLVDLFGETDQSFELLTQLFRQQGEPLEQLHMAAGLDQLIFSPARKSFIGYSSNIGSKLRFEEQCWTVVGRTRPSEDDWNSPECCVCLCPPEADIYRAEACGHAYCNECIHDHVRHRIDGLFFPVTCAADGCEISFTARELERLADGAFKKGPADLANRLVSAYVTVHQEAWAYCPHPSCRGLVYRDDRFERYHCQECTAGVCRKCLAPSHPGDCATFLAETSFKQWMASDKKDRKRCPNCTSAIEKVDGCNRISCVACKVHICWACLAFFNDMTLCYDHLSKVHNGYE